jgi:outer membrane protein OmpA-like peptidoglycan-associated protein
MKISHLSLLFLLLSFLSACSSSRVVLLDNGKQQNAIIIKTKASETVLDKANSYAKVSAFGTSNIKPISSTELQQEYGDLIAIAPKPPIHFLLYFTPDQTTLTTASRQTLPQIEQAIRDRMPCEINIIGHADSPGSKQYNVDLSLKRARFVQQWIASRELDIINTYVESYGEEDPLIPTPDGVSEPRNRRVEILIR